MSVLYALRCQFSVACPPGSAALAKCCLAGQWPLPVLLRGDETWVLLGGTIIFPSSLQPQRLCLYLLRPCRLFLPFPTSYTAEISMTFGSYKKARKRMVSQKVWPGRWPLRLGLRVIVGGGGQRPRFLTLSYCAAEKTKHGYCALSFPTTKALYRTVSLLGLP